MLTGRGRYVSDWNLPGQAYAYFVRSDRAHAEIISIEPSEALRAPGVVAVFTGADLDLKSLPAALPTKGRGGMELINPGRPALAKGRVRFAGDALALVVAESATAAQDAAELVAVEYRDLPAVVGSREALAAGAPLVHDSVPGNMVLDYESGDEAKARAAFAAAAKVVKLDVRSEEHTSELQSLAYLVCRLLLEKKKHTSTACSSSPIAKASSSRPCPK